MNMVHKLTANKILTINVTNCKINKEVIIGVLCSYRNVQVGKEIGNQIIRSADDKLEMQKFQFGNGKSANWT